MLKNRVTWLIAATARSMAPSTPSAPWLRERRAGQVDAVAHACPLRPADVATARRS